METNQEVLFCTREFRDRDANCNKEPELKRRNFDARRVSKSILNEILNELHKVNHTPPAPHRIFKIRREIPTQKEIMPELKPETEPIPLNKSSSMYSLIIWNISKAIELKPDLDLKSSIKAAKQHLDSDTRDLSLCQGHPEQQHLLCALLAWQQLGHHDADSLYRFVEPKVKETSDTSKCMSKPNNNSNNIHESMKSTNIHRHAAASRPFFPKPSVDGSFGPHTTGPVVKLPVETKIIMRLQNDQIHQGCRHGTRGAPKRPEKETLHKIDAACCLDSQCKEQLAVLDKKTSELRVRASQLARREAERAQLLERAEAAWKDLEAGYQKRLALAEEKENDMRKQITKLISDRNDFKEATKILTRNLKCKADVTEQARTKLTTLEKQVYDLAGTKLSLSEEAAKGEAALAEKMCQVAQYERDLRFKESQARRKLEQLDSEAESARALTCEAERAMRAELAGLREQIENVSKELLQEDNANIKLKEEHARLREEKNGLIEDLEGCKTICDKKMQGRLDELRTKKEKLLALQEQALECRCKMPIDAKVQVKRTPSLAAMCHCAPEDNLLESCSCTSLRGRLLSTLLSDLFGGLQAELGGTGLQMPCQLLKCLEDQHNWDRTSVTKTNIRNFFSKLLKSELDIAIATSIENYHAKWVGASCADVAKMTPSLEDDLKEGWQDRAIERRAQKMATQLAEGLFQQRSQEVEQRAKAILTAGPAPCECKPPQPRQAAVFPCLMPLNSPFNPATTTNTSKTLAINQQTGEITPPAFWKQTIQDVTQLKLQIEDLKKDSMKKEDWKLMEENILKIIKEASVIENEQPSAIKMDHLGYSDLDTANIKKDTDITRIDNRNEYSKTSHRNNLVTTKKKEGKSVSKKAAIYEKPTKQSKNQGHGQSYAVNLCLCGPQQNTKSLQNSHLHNGERSSGKHKSLKDVIPQSSVVKQTKPINFNIPSPELQETITNTTELCNSNCKCFNKMPSNTSIDRLLRTLTLWNYDLVSQEDGINNNKNSLSKCSKTTIKEAVRTLNQNDSKNNKSTSFATNKNPINVSDIYDDTNNMNTAKQQSSLKQPVITESEYMGTVDLDKSHENMCKCITNILSKKEYQQEQNEDGHNKVPFQCINANACDCKIYKEMQKDHKRSQTEESYKVHVRSNQCQVMLSKDVLELNSNLKNGVNSQNGILINPGTEKKSDVNNVPQKKELFSSNGEYYIKFLGVTLDDLNSNKKTKRNIKTIDHNTGVLIVPKDKHIESQNKYPMKLSTNDQFNSLTKSKIRERNDESSLNDNTNCECKAKFEKFSSFMNNFFDNKNETTHKDKVEKEKCICCDSSNVDDSKDLEVNAFHLLEDHIKGKIEEFKSFSCNSKCIPPEEEAKLYSTILQRVKQVISDYANTMKCGCSGGPNTGSWNRVYGLLQEYMKIKIKRVRCLCVLNDNKDVLLPEVLEKVFNLIENDFQRLKDICKCRNGTETRTKMVCMEDLALPPTDLPEKDTSMSQSNFYNNVEVQNSTLVTKYSKQNSNNSMILKENISSQVPPNLGMEAKSCDIMGPQSKNAHTTETDPIITSSISNEAMINTCDCCYNTDNVDIRNFPDMFGTKGVLVNLYTEQAIDTNEIFKLPEITTNKESIRCLSVSLTESMKVMEKKEINENDEIKLDAPNREVNSSPTPRAPYIGYTVNCSCDGAVGPCFCMKSVVRANNDKIESFWKELLVNNDNNQKFSYIMQGNQNNNSDVVNCHSIPDDPLIDETTNIVLSNDVLTREVESTAENENDVVLKHSLKNVNFIHRTANTADETLSLETAYSTSEPDTIDWIKSPVHSGRLDALKLANSIYFPGLPIENDNSYNSSTGTEHVTQKLSDTCDCDKVPICHVKMLVEHIEKNLVESKCICDSLISKACPVHSKRVS